jgi:hypothetical protein
MNRFKWRLARLAAVSAVAVAAATASPAVAATGSYMPWHCSFETPSAFGTFSATVSPAARAGERDPAGWKDPPIEDVPDSAKGRGGKNFRATIDVYVHIATDGSVGNLTSQQIQRQIQVMNAGFGGFEGGYATGFSFKLAGVDRTNNSNWFYNSTYGSPVQRDFKAATHTGGANVLNIWTTNGPGYLGFATFPSMYKHASYQDGIVLDYNSFPGGAYGEAFSLGKTATHEIGHWLGLLHTFQGGCNDKGDYVADTPPMLVPTSGCPVGKDTCRDPGLDPIRNYMDYSWDSCYNQFTADQAARMQDMWLYFRADGGRPVGS